MPERAAQRVLPLRRRRVIDHPLKDRSKEREKEKERGKERERENFTCK